MAHSSGGRVSKRELVVERSCSVLELVDIVTTLAVVDFMYCFDLRGDDGAFVSVADVDVESAAILVQKKLYCSQEFGCDYLSKTAYGRPVTSHASLVLVWTSK